LLNDFFIDGVNDLLRTTGVSYCATVAKVNIALLSSSNCRSSLAQGLVVYTLA